MASTIFSERLKIALQLRGKTAADIARSTTISNASLSQYINGRFFPKANTIRIIAKYLNVSDGWLAGEDVPMQRIDNELPSEEKVKVALFGGDEDVSEEEWQEVQNFVAYLKSKRGEKN